MSTPIDSMERKAREQQKDNMIQVQLAQEYSFRKDARLKSIQLAAQLRPSTPYGSTIMLPNYDVIREAEKIYQWLIKDL